MKQTLYIAGIILFLWGCKKNIKPPHEVEFAPTMFRFVIDSSGTFLIKNTKQSIKMWYCVSGGGKSYVDLTIDSLPPPYKYGYRCYCHSLLAASKSVNTDKNFYLQMDNGKIDSIYLDVVKLPEPEGFLLYKYKEVRLNGKPFDIEHDDGIYILKK